MKRNLTNVIGYIYKIVSPNGKIYIGQTINKKQRKYHYNSGCYKEQIKLWNNVQCYNWNPASTFEIIEECECGLDKINLNEREKFWINYFDSFKNGLNCNEGGHGNLGHKASDETKLKMSNSKKGVKHSEERNKQKSDYTKGRKHSDDAKLKMSQVKLEKMTDEIKDKISLGLRGNKNGLGNRGSAKRVLCINNDVVYESITEAAKKLNLHSSGIVAVCKGEFKQTKGFKFKYYE